MLALEVETTRGPVVLSTLYLPPCRNNFPYQDMLSIMRLHKPAYLVGDLNGRHTSLGYNGTSDSGRAILNLVRRYLVRHLEPDFSTWIHPDRTGTPDLVLGNRHIHHNITIQQGPLTTSDHIPIIMSIATKPILMEGRKVYNYKKAN